MAGPDLFDTLLRVHGAEHLGRQYVFVRLARMNIAGHIDYSEISRILQGINRRSDWVTTWMDASQRHHEMAIAAERRGATETAGDAYIRSSLCAHWASLYAEAEAKTTAHLRSLELYSAGSAWFRPPAERVEIPFDGDALPAYLRAPTEHEGRLVVMLGGADTNKEELHHWGTEFSRRGLMVLAVDGPGQGELAARYGRLEMDFQRYHQSVSTTIDWIAKNLSDVERIGVFGNSLGGYLALDAALRDTRIDAVISNGGFCDAASREKWPRGVAEAFSSCTGIHDGQQLDRHIQQHLDLTKVPSVNSPNALVIHGGLEDLSDEAEARRAAQQANGTLLVIEDGFHTCTNRDHVMSPVLADWMRAALDGQLRGDGFKEVHIRDEYGYRALFDVVGT